MQQDVFLFIGTIRENIAFGRPDASMEEIIAAAKIARIHDFIMSLPQGYDEWVGERGVTLSGGQKQRIAIARTLLLDPKIIILDDSTASVDMHTEFLIQQALSELMTGRTTFVIAQRLRTIMRADEIVVLDHGRIVERGKHSELIEKQGLYRRIYDLELKDQEEALGRGVSAPVDGSNDTGLDGLQYRGPTSVLVLRTRYLAKEFTDDFMGRRRRRLVAGHGWRWPGGMRRTHDGWDEDYLGKVYDAEVVRRLLPYMKEWKFHALGSLILLIITAVSQFIQPLLIGFITRAALRGDTSAVELYGGMMVVFALVQMSSQMAQQLLTAWMGTRILRKLQSAMYDHVQELSLSFFDEMEVGRIISRLTSDVQVVQDLLTTGSLSSLANVLGISIIIVILLSLDWQLALVTFAVLPPLILIMVFWARAARAAFMQTRQTISALYGNLAESISGVRATQSMSREGENSRRFDRLNDQNRVSNNWAALVSSAAMPVIEIAVAIGVSAVLIVGGLRAINSNYSRRRQPLSVRWRRSSCTLRASSTRSAN